TWSCGRERRRPKGRATGAFQREGPVNVVAFRYSVVWQGEDIYLAPFQLPNGRRARPRLRAKRTNPASADCVATLLRRILRRDRLTSQGKLAWDAAEQGPGDWNEISTGTPPREGTANLAARLVQFVRHYQLSGRWYERPFPIHGSKGGTPMGTPRKKQLTRREFTKAISALATISIVPRHVLGGAGQQAPSDKLNVGCVGVGGMQGANDVRSVSSENIYALCDVDEKHLAKIAQQYPKAKVYRDFREMLDKEHKNLQGVTVTIPDHMHATVALWAMERGLGVYCQKPLTQSVWEARLLTKAAEKYKVATQMGNQGYSSAATRTACEIIWKGEIGDVTEVHSMSNGGFSRGVTTWPPVEEVPK